MHASSLNTGGGTGGGSCRSGFKKNASTNKGGPRTETGWRVNGEVITVDELIEVREIKAGTDMFGAMQICPIIICIINYMNCHILYINF